MTSSKKLAADALKWSLEEFSHDVFHWTSFTSALLV